MDKKAMVEALVSHYTNGNKAQFANILGVSAQTISAWIARNTLDVELVYSKCSDLSADWLLTGRGSMLRDEQPAQVPVQVSAPTIIYKSDPKDMALLNAKDEIIALQDDKIRMLEDRLNAYTPVLDTARAVDVVTAAVMGTKSTRK